MLIELLRACSHNAFSDTVRIMRSSLVRYGGCLVFILKILAESLLALACGMILKSLPLLHYFSFDTLHRFLYATQFLIISACINTYENKPRMCLNFG